MFGLITRCFLKEITSKVVERLLFLYAKLNPGQGYVQVILFFGGFHAVTSVQQGMNEKYETQKREKVKVGKVRWKEEWKEDERKVEGERSR